VSAFDFFFSLFGLILGLAVAVLITGLTDILRERHRVAIGWLTPMLGLFLLFDLTTVWVNSWEGLKTIEVAYGPFLSGMIIAAAYFFAANMVFPKDASEWPSLDDYYLKHYRFVLGGVLFANFGVAVIDGVSKQSFAAFLRDFVHTELGVIWWVTLIAMMFIPRRGFQLAGLTIVLLEGLDALVVFWHPR
jgi:hypothetical protein